jgi:hypothetical protein
MNMTLEQAIVVAGAQAFTHSGPMGDDTEEIKEVMEDIVSLLGEVGEPDRLAHGQLLAERLTEIRDSE